MNNFQAIKQKAMIGWLLVLAILMVIIFMALCVAAWYCFGRPAQIALRKELAGKIPASVYPIDLKRILPPSTILLVTKVISNNCFSQCHKIMGGSNNFDSSLYFEGIVLLCSLIPISANRSVRWKDFREKIYIILSPVKKYIECASNKDMLSLHFQGLFAKMCICYNV